jgi:hypothetical protein
VSWQIVGSAPPHEASWQRHTLSARFRSEKCEICLLQQTVCLLHSQGQIQDRQRDQIANWAFVSSETEPGNQPIHDPSIWKGYLGGVRPRRMSD